MTPIVISTLENFYNTKFCVFHILAFIMKINFLISSCHSQSNFNKISEIPSVILVTQKFSSIVYATSQNNNNYISLSYLLARA